MDERSGAVVALKDVGIAKSRFATLAPAVRRRLAELMAVTVTRTLTEVVDEVVLVTAAPGIGGLLAAHGVTVRTLPDPGVGLNAAFDVGADALRDHGCELVLAVMADLPAITAGALRGALAQCEGPGRWFVPDATGLGTTMLVSRAAVLEPLFGGESADRHRRSGAIELSAQPGLRRDVDDEADLTEARALGIGAPAADLVGANGPTEHHTAIVAGPEAGGLGVITEAGHRLIADRSAIAADFPQPARGQRVHLLIDDQGIRHLWL